MGTHQSVGFGKGTPECGFWWISPDYGLREKRNRRRRNRHKREERKLRNRNFLSPKA